MTITQARTWRRRIPGVLSRKKIAPIKILLFYYNYRIIITIKYRVGHTTIIIKIDTYQ
jgi:hypothetical protein